MSVVSIEDINGYYLIEGLAIIYVYSFGSFALKYVGIFMVSEGSSMLSGMAYNGEKIANGVITTDWNECQNFDINKVQEFSFFNIVLIEQAFFSVVSRSMAVR